MNNAEKLANEAIAKYGYFTMASLERYDVGERIPGEQIGLSDHSEAFGHDLVIVGKTTREEHQSFMAEYNPDGGGMLVDVAPFFYRVTAE